MLQPRLFCGDALCKAPLTSSIRADGKWPVRCDACGSALYPEDVLARLLPNELEPKRAELMTERAGVRVSVRSTDLAPPAPAPTAKSEGVDVDKILAMVELDPAGAERRRGRKKLVIISVIATVVVVLAALAARLH